MSKHALPVTREADFPAWYQAVVRDADLAELSPVRGCMVIKPWGYGVWELLQRQLDDRIKAFGFENCYFPLFIPLGFFSREADHVEGFAKEMAVVTHHRLKSIGGQLRPDPEAELDEPLIVRPTSETIIGDSFQRWIKSYRDLPVRINQWANVVRWEMRTRMFLRTAEFLWQEGHSAHASEAEARDSTMAALELYRAFAEEVLALPTVAGEKTENERFPGADNTYSIEAAMQDGKALQAGTSHYLGTHFAESQGIKFQNREGGESHAFTTSWGMSTRMIGGLIMAHGDDDGFRCPPMVAPRQIVIVPMLRDRPEDAEVSRFCEALRARLCAHTFAGAPVRAHLDARDIKSAEKRWGWIRRGAPVIVEVGPRDVGNGAVTVMRRDRLREGDKVASTAMPVDSFVDGAAALLGEIQARLLADARALLENNVRTDIDSWEALAAYYGAGGGDDEEGGERRGWVRCAWARPTGAALEAAVERLKTLKLTIRNAPLDQPAAHGRCIFTGAPATETILLARAY